MPPNADCTMMEIVTVINAKQPQAVKEGPEPSTRQKKRRSVSWWVGGLLLINAALGVGVLHLPYASLVAGGIFPAMVAQMIVVFLLFATMISICFCADLSGESSYGGIMGSLSGPVAKWLAIWCIALSTFGVCVAYLVIIGDQFDRLFHSLIGNDFCDKFYLSREFTITFSAFTLILPMSFIKRVDLLKWICSLGVIVMFYPVLLTALFYYGYGENWIARDQPIIRDVSIDHESKSLTGNLIAISTVIPALCFSFQSHEIIVPVYSSFRQRNVRQIVLASAFCMIALLIVYSFTGAFGYLALGEDVRDDVMLNFDPTSPIVLVGIIVLIVKSITSYPFMLICGRECLEIMFQEGLTDYPKKARHIRRAITVLWFLLTLLCTLVISDLSSAIESVGVLSFANIFIFPGICLFQVARRREAFGVRHPIAAMVAGCIQVFVGIIFATTFVLNKFVWATDVKESSQICISLLK